MTAMTVGELTAAHVGGVVTLNSAPEGLWGGDNPVTAVLSRVQHNAETLDSLTGDRRPAETLVSIGPVSVSLTPWHPIALADEGGE